MSHRCVSWWKVTDARSVGTARWTNNWELGLDRARSVARALNAEVLHRHRIEIASNGDAPIALLGPSVAQRSVVIQVYATDVQR